MTAEFDKAIAELAPWVGRQRIVEDEIGLSSVRRIAGMLDLEPEDFVAGTPLPPHWFTMFFPDTTRQSDIGPDGHPNKGVILPPIPLPRRMGAGRRVTINGRLKVGETARKIAEVVAMVPKDARTGQICVLTMRHTIEANGEVLAVDEFDAIYRDVVLAGQKSATTTPRPALTDPDWSETRHLPSALVFRYSAVTWNAHRIHYDADYTRDEEGYPAMVQNGGLTMQLMVDTALRQTDRELVGYATKLTRPISVNDTVTFAGRGLKDGRIESWVADADGAQCAEMSLDFA
jgi:3-methylfumaryl-CoA hydratase